MFLHLIIKFEIHTKKCNNTKERNSKSIKKIRKNTEYVNIIHQFNLTYIYSTLSNTAKHSHTCSWNIKTNHMDGHKTSFNKFQRLKSHKMLPYQYNTKLEINQVS